MNSGNQKENRLSNEDSLTALESRIDNFEHELSQLKKSLAEIKQQKFRGVAKNQDSDSHLLYPYLI